MMPLDDDALFLAVRETLIETLGLVMPARELTAATPLFGSLPELDSMGVVLLLTALEDRFDLLLSDEEIDAQWFSTLGNLVAALAARRDRAGVLPH
ncbi:acyl carrier protein [Halothiobacillus sp. DCM-1]|uniref:acyl carrier protein n=1 Tax=Halothiobacillus sp. DCM-1 TaxID=3112558 RepID=UPI00324EE0B7